LVSDRNADAFAGNDVIDLAFPVGTGVSGRGDAKEQGNHKENGGPPHPEMFASVEG
jgi:hypothetical protein